MTPNTLRRFFLRGLFLPLIELAASLASSTAFSTPTLAYPPSDQIRFHQALHHSSESGQCGQWMCVSRQVMLEQLDGVWKDIAAEVPQV
jgi:hypothetical protein